MQAVLGFALELLVYGSSGKPPPVGRCKANDKL